MRHPEFEAALSQARRTPELWRLLLGMLLCLFVYLTTAISVFAVPRGLSPLRKGRLPLCLLYKALRSRTRLEK